MLFSGVFTDEQWSSTEKRENRFCFIGRDLPRARIEEMFRLALHDGAPLRFKVGDQVLASVDREHLHEFVVELPAFLELLGPPRV